MSTPEITKAVVTYKIGTTLVNIHMLRKHLSLIEFEWEGLKSSTPEFMRDQIAAIRVHVDLMDAKMHELDAENRTNPN